jgi:menaquinone-dependent protoporphyrinogen IX oxidase
MGMSDNSILVLYKSKYGSTKQYAEWLGSSLSATVKSVDAASAHDLEQAKIVVIGGSVRIGKITCAPFIVRHWNILKDKRILLFAVAGTPPESPEVRSYFEGSLPANIRSSVAFFPLPGRHVPLDLGDRFLVWFPKTGLRFRARFAKTADERAAAEKDYRMMNELSDHVNRDSLAPIIASCR